MSNPSAVRAKLRHLPLISLALVVVPSGALAADEAPPGERTYAPTDIIVTAQSGYAEDDGSTATKTPSALIDTPQAVTILTRDQLDDQNATQLGEALRYVSGISLESGEGNRDAVFIRGQESTADFYLNGLRDDAQYYRSLYNVDRVEVLKGANALIFGRGGGGGVINRVTKQAEPGRAFVSGSASLDTFSAFALAADINRPLSDSAAARINATYEEFDSHRDFYQGRFFGISPTVSLDIGAATRLVLDYTYDDDERLTDRGIPSFAGAPIAGYDRTLFGSPTFNDARTKTHIARARLDHDFSASLSANASVQYAGYDKLYANIVPERSTGSTVDLTGYRDTTDRENWIGQGNLIWQVATGSVRHTLLAGVEGISQDTDNARQNALFARPGGGTAGRITVPLARVLTLPAISLTAPIRDRRSRLDVFSAYLQDQVELTRWLQVIAGLRYESFDLKTVDTVSGVAAGRRDEKWSPRFGVVVKPQDTLSFYASYAQSFLPQAGDQFTILSPAASRLEPEEFENIELGVKWALRPQLLLTGAVFQLDRSNGQATDPANPGFVILTGKTRTKGVELQLAGNITPSWNANLGYTYLDGTVRSATTGAPAGRRLEQVPEHHLAAWTRYDVSAKVGVGAGVVHSSSQFASLSNAVRLPAYTRVDAAVYYDVSPQVALQINVDNLFDEDYYPSAHGDNNIQPAKPFGASVSARVRF